MVGKQRESRKQEQGKTMRKTCEIHDLIDSVNNRNNFSICSSEVRQGWNSLLTEILNKADVYSGYRYLSEGEVPAGQLPGIKGEPGSYEFPDETRRQFHVHWKL